MHDTTQKHLFNNAVRAESHGCMRVQNPDQLAELVLAHDKGWSKARVQSTFDAGDDNHVALDRKIPVYITYFTLRVNDDGSISTFRDLYGHDARMTAALNGKTYFGDAVAQDSDLDRRRGTARDAGQWNGRDQANGRRSRRVRGDRVDDFARSLFGF